MTPSKEEINLITNIILETATYADFAAVSEDADVIRELLLFKQISLLKSWGITPISAAANWGGVLLSDENTKTYRYSIFNNTGTDTGRGLLVEYREQKLD